MEAIKLYRKIDSDTIYIPELRRFFGKNMEIILLEVPEASPVKHSSDMKAFFELAGKIQIDGDDIVNLREKSMI